MINIKANIKKVPIFARTYRKFVRAFSFSQRKQNRKAEDLSKLSSDQLLSLMRHESHRIEKTIYNDILGSKYETYRKKWDKLSNIYGILERRKYDMTEPTVIWSKKIYNAFDNLEEKFIRANSLPPTHFDPSQNLSFKSLLRSRRSVRVWAEQQPNQEEFDKLAYDMIDAARWAPTSGNRQPWRFLVLVKPEEKELLRGVKEQHCISAPLLIYVGMDTRLYGAFSNSERSIYIDAGAAIMQMVLLAHNSGMGVCWNHFADDLLSSRKGNQIVYSNFAERMGIPDYIAPVAIVATGVSKFIPPEPARMSIESLLIGANNHLQ